MKNIYIVKHYWDENSYGATLEPSYLFSSSKLNKEEKRVKEIISYYISLTQYNRLALEKPSFEKRGKFYIYFCYKDKDDPDPSNNRKVTDITFIVSPSQLSHPCELTKRNLFKIPIEDKNYLFYIVGGILILIGISGLYFFQSFRQTNSFTPSFSNNTNFSKVINNNGTNSSSALSTQMTVESKKIAKIKKKCKELSPYWNVEVKKCYQKFLSAICLENYKGTYNQWLHQNIRCASIVGSMETDKELQQAPQDLIIFIKRFPNEF